MKKIHSVLSMFLVLLFLMTFASCDVLGDKVPTQTETKTQTDKAPFVPQSAAEAWEKIDQTMDEVYSYEGTMSGELRFYLQGAEYLGHITGALFVIDSEEEYSYFSSDEFVFEIPSQEMRETVRSLDAYFDGKMYVSYQDSSYDQKLVSEVSEEKYRQLQDEDVSISEIDFTACTTSDFQQKEDGTWELHFSGYTKKTIDGLLDVTAMEEDQFGADIEDMTVTVIATEDFHAKELIIEMVFDSDATVSPMFKMTAVYSNYNSASCDRSQIKEEEYTSVPDAYLLTSLEEYYEEASSAAKGAFLLTATTTAKAAGVENSETESCEVEYGTENGGFYYNIKASVNGGNYQVQYKGGTETVTDGVETKTYSVTQEQAVAYIDSVINIGAYNKISVSSMEKLSEGVYRLKIAQAKNASYDGLLDPSTGITINSAEQEMVVTFSGDTVQKVEAKRILFGSFLDGGRTESIVIETTQVLEMKEVSSGAAA